MYEDDVPAPRRFGVVASGTVQGLMAGVALGVLGATLLGVAIAVAAADGVADAMFFTFWALVIGVPVGLIAGLSAGVMVGLVLDDARSRDSARVLRVKAAGACLLTCATFAALLVAVLGIGIAPLLLILLPTAAAIAAWRAPDIADPSRR